MSYASYYANRPARQSPPLPSSTMEPPASQQFLLGHTTVVRAPAPSGLRAISKLQVMTEEEFAAMSAAADRLNFNYLARRLGRLMDHVKLTRSQADGSNGARHPDIGVGSIVLFPTSPFFQWTQAFLDGNWLICEITAIDDDSGSRRLDDQVATLIAWRHAKDLAAADLCFRHQPGEKFLISTWPQNFVQLVDSTELREDRRGQTGAHRVPEPTSAKRKERPTSSPGACTSISSSLLQDDEGELGTGGVKVMVDDDGRTHTYNTPAATLMKQELRHIWRTMSGPKQKVLVPGPSLDNDLWSRTILRYIDQSAPVGIHPELAQLYEASSIKNAKVSSDPALAERARRMKWTLHDWESLSILHFLTNPRLSATVCIAGNSDKDACLLFADAVTGWKEWMAVHFDTAFLKSLRRLDDWLRQSGAKRTNRLDGCRLRFLIESLFFQFHAALTDHSSDTRFDGISFAISNQNTPARLLAALEEELFTKAAEDPIPHPLHQDWLTRNKIIGMTSGTRPAVAPKSRLASDTTSTDPTPPSTRQTPQPPPPSPARALSLPICPWHAGFLLNCADSSGAVKPCQMGASCNKPHVDVKTIKTTELRQVCSDALRPGVFRDRVLAAIESADQDRRI